MLHCCVLLCPAEHPDTLQLFLSMSLHVEETANTELTREQSMVTQIFGGFSRKAVLEAAAVQCLQVASTLFRGKSQYMCFIELCAAL